MESSFKEGPMSDSLHIRRAVAADAGLILSLIRELADYERMLDQVTATEAGIRATLFGARPAAECVIAEQDGKPAGFALYFHNYSTFLGKPGLYLEDLYVKPELRGKGIGRKLLAYLARLALERGCGRFEWAVLDWNEPAIGFYTRIGAKLMDEWTICRVEGEALAH